MRSFSSTIIMANLSLKPRYAPAAVSVSAWAISIICCFGTPLAAQVFFVDANSPACPAGDGSSWASAFCKLQDALEAVPGGSQIWIAKGVYYPDEGGGQIEDDRHASFTLRNGIAIYGGFAGTETSLAERDWKVNETILCGDINQSNTLDGNSFSVVTGSGTDSSAVLDGVTIRRGHSNGSGIGPEYAFYGGGMYNHNGSPTVRYCTFSGNKALAGGGMFNKANASPIVSHCHFHGNTGGSGGGMHNESNAHPTITDCIFSWNEAANGGGMYNWLGSAPLISNCDFFRNSGGTGSGAHNRGATPTFYNCSFRGNLASGGGMTNEDSDPLLVNCTITGNNGAMSNQRSSPTLLNCTISYNRTFSRGCGMLNVESSPVLYNCVIWGNTIAAFWGENTPEESVYNVTPDSRPQFFHCLVANSGGSGSGWIDEVGIDNGNNLDVDPLFTLLPPPFMTADTSGNFRPLRCSPLVDAGSNTAYFWVDSLDLDHNPRFSDATLSGSAIVDIGAYESQVPVSSMTLIEAVACGSSYIWNDVTYTESGTYIQNATDVNGCDSTLQLQLTFGEDAAETLSISACSSYTLNDISYTASGTYTQILTNAVGCDSILTLHLTIGEPFALEIAAADASCPSSADGQATVSAVQGALPLSYLWSDGQSTATASSLNPGQYAVTVTDANGCTAAASVTVEAQYQMFISFTVSQNILCHGDSSAAVSVSAIGGVAPFSYQWGHGAQVPSLTGLPAGAYPVTVSDANQCAVSGMAVFAAPPLLEVSIAAQPTPCAAAAEGTAAAEAAGGVPPYQYLWSDGQTTPAAISLPEGLYELILTDANGCTAEAGITIDALAFEPQLAIEQEGPALTVAEPDAEYQWIDCDSGEPILGATQQSFIAEVSGNYAVILSQGACQAVSDCVEVMVVSLREAGTSVAKAEVFPNPNSGQFNLNLPWAAVVELYDATGRLLRQQHYDPGEHHLEIDAPNGLYWLLMKHQAGTQEIKVARQ